MWPRLSKTCLKTIELPLHSDGHAVDLLRPASVRMAGDILFNRALEFNCTELFAIRSMSYGTLITIRFDL